MGKALGLDVGTKTIGVAISDSLGIGANPICTLKRHGVRRDVEKLVEIVKGKGIDKLIVGLPLELDDSESRSARLARQVGDALGEALGLPPIYIDERYSSVDAEEVLVMADLSRKRRKQVIDQTAAVFILQSYLNHGDWSGLNG
jgi:putative Holliday junction resolvase